MASYSPTKLKDDLICPICFEEYDLKRIPKMLDCNHTFCGQCLVASKVKLIDCIGLPLAPGPFLVPGSLKCAICRIVYLNVNIDDLIENYVITGHLKKIEEEKDREIALQLHEELNAVWSKNKSYNFSALWNRKKDKEDTKDEENKPKESKIKKRSRISKMKDVGILVSKYNLRAKKSKTGEKEAEATSENYNPGECVERLRESNTEAEKKPKKTPAKKNVKTPTKKVASKTSVKKTPSKKTSAKRSIEEVVDSNSSEDDEPALINNTKAAPTGYHRPPKSCLGGYPGGYPRAKKPAKIAVKTPAKKVASKTPAKKLTSKTPAKKTPARKTPAKKTPSKRSVEEVIDSDSSDDDEPLIKKKKAAPTPMKPPAKKAVKTPAKKVASKTPSKKVASKSPANKTPAKKTSAKKTPAKKTPTKRSVEKVVDSDSLDDDEPLINYYLLML